MRYRTAAAKWAELAAAARAATSRMVRESLDFSIRVYEKAGQDDIFFLAGGIAFNILLAAIPFLLLVVAAVGFVLPRLFDNPQTVAVNYVLSVLPAQGELGDWVRRFVDGLIAERARSGVLGLLLFVWASARLFGSMRSVMKSIFDIHEDRGVVGGKIFDLQMVLVGGVLFLVNTGITLVLEAVQRFGLQWLGIAPGARLQAIQSAYAQLLAFGFTFLMFMLMYRYLPARRIPWRIALVAATFTGVVWESLKGAFAWYVTNLGSYATTYGALATLVILVFWIYYSAVVFILGGEVAQIYELNRIRRRQKELLE